MTEFIHPGHFHVFRRADDATWKRREAVVFCRLSDGTTLPPCQADWDLQALYGISAAQVVVKLFKVNGGAIGYYLADLSRKQYHYCGLELEGVRSKLAELGIGQPERSGS